MARATKLPTGISKVTRQRRNGPQTMYQVRVTWEGTRHLVGRFETLTDARKAREIALGEIATKTFTPPTKQRAAAAAKRAAQARSSITVRELYNDWIEHLERLGRKQGTIYSYQRRAEKHILPTFGDMAVVDVTPENVQTWFDDIHREHGPGVSRTAYATTAALFTFATGKAPGQGHTFEPIITTSPCYVPGASKHRPVSERVDDDAVIDDHQLEILARHMPEHERIAVLIGGWQGLRRGEILGLQRRDVKDGWLTVERQLQSRGAGLAYDRPKSKAGTRELPIFPNLATTFEKHLREHVSRGKTSPLIPRVSGSPEPLSPNSLRNHFVIAIEAANTELKAEQHEPIPAGFSLHGLRHTALTRIGANGATISELMRFAGHDDPQVVQRYQHATRDRLTALVTRSAPMENDTNAQLTTD